MSPAPIAPRGPYHDFWLIEEEERAYSDYGDLGIRRDSPLRVPDDVLESFVRYFDWLSPLNPANSKNPILEGLNRYGPTVFRREDGKAFEKFVPHFGACTPVHRRRSP